VSEVTSRRVVLQPSTTEVIFAWFQRVIAGYCLLFGILYWIRLIGIYPGELWRFDLMPVHWQVAAATLAVFFPFAAAGLWMLASWGPVIWFICAITRPTSASVTCAGCGGCMIINTNFIWMLL